MHKLVTTTTKAPPGAVTAAVSYSVLNTENNSVQEVVHEFKIQVRQPNCAAELSLIVEFYEGKAIFSPHINLAIGKRYSDVFLLLLDGELLMPFLVNTNLTGLGSPRIYDTF